MSKKANVRKYQLSAKLNALSHEEYRIVTNKLPIACGVSKRTFYRWMDLNREDKTEIPADKLAILAKYFSCSIEDMFNYQVPQYNTKQLAKMDRKSALKNAGLNG